MRSLAAATPRNQLHAFLDRAGPWGQGAGRREPGPTRSTVALTFVPYSLSNAAAAVAASKRGMWPQDWGQYSHCVWGLSAELPNVSRQDFLGRSPRMSEHVLVEVDLLPRGECAHKARVCRRTHRSLPRPKRTRCTLWRGDLDVSRGWQWCLLHGRSTPLSLENTTRRLSASRPTGAQPDTVHGRQNGMASVPTLAMRRFRGARAEGFETLQFVHHTTDSVRFGARRFELVDLRMDQKSVHANQIMHHGPCLTSRPATAMPALASWTPAASAISHELRCLHASGCLTYLFPHTKYLHGAGAWSVVAEARRDLPEVAGRGGRK